MNRRGFTLVELLATLVILGIVTSIVVIGINGGFNNAKDKTEDVFVKTVKDAMDIYLDSDAKKLNFSKTAVCTLSKTHGKSNVYKGGIIVGYDDDGIPIVRSVILNDVINSEFHPITEDDLVNPVNGSKCNKNTVVNIYRDDDYVYYYEIDSDMGCLVNTKSISILPEEC